MVMPMWHHETDKHASLKTTMQFQGKLNSFLIGFLIGPIKRNVRLKEHVRTAIIKLKFHCTQNPSIMCGSEM
jgi:hypothetical protein